MALKEDELRNWVDLPREVTASILSRLTAEDTLTSAQFVCKSWLEVSNDPLVWKRIDMQYFGDCDFDYDSMCRNAVDRSSGQAVDVNIEYFGDHTLLQYISDRLSKIERLRFTNCDDIFDKALIRTVKKLPLLEDLELTLCSFEPEAIEGIGRNCPSLKSFKWNTTAYKVKDKHMAKLEDTINKEAFAIGKNMPGLKNLMLVGNTMTNKGLEEILRGCPGLESLDLRKCLNIKMNGKVWEMCMEKVKLLRLPGDSTNDYPFETGPDSDDERFGFEFDSDYDDDEDDDDDDEDDDDENPWNYHGDEFDYYDDEYGFPDFSDGDYPFDYDDFTVPDNYW